MPSVDDPARGSACCAGDPRAIARAISLVEDETPAGAALIGEHLSRGPDARIWSASPGRRAPGKSTLVDRLDRRDPARAA